MNYKIAVVIPTYQRHEKLKRCIDSILASKYQNIDIYVYCDSQDMNSYNFVNSQYSDKNVYCFVNPDRRFVIGSWNRFFKDQIDSDWQLAMWCCDDVELYPDTISKAVECFEYHYPEHTDGIIGLSQECPNNPQYTYKPFGQILIGKDFVRRYAEAEYQVCCPNYQFLYQDEELYQFATSLGKFYHCRNAVLLHYHPAFIPSEIDSTHWITRRGIAQQDKMVFKKRQDSGLIWGKSWKML